MATQHKQETSELRHQLISQSVKVVRSNHLPLCCLLCPPLTLQLKDLETTLDSHRHLTSRRSPDRVISLEEKLALQSEMREQEVLLQGYQKVVVMGGRGMAQNLSPHRNSFWTLPVQ
jgi:hypothetical protein